MLLSDCCLVKFRYNCTGANEFVLKVADLAAANDSILLPAVTIMCNTEVTWGTTF